MALSITLNAQHVNRMTPFDLAIHSGKLEKNACTVLDTLTIQVVLTRYKKMPRQQL